MSELRDAGRMIEAAEQAAIGEDFTVADELLRVAARIQEAELGPLHPDLANTLNNRAIVGSSMPRPVSMTFTCTSPALGPLLGMDA